MKSCEASISSSLGRRSKPVKCDKPAFYWWAPRQHPARMMALCKAHGEEIAGNFTDELTPIAKEKPCAK